MTKPGFDIADPAAADRGLGRIEWALSEMPVLQGLCERFAAERPLAGVRISGR